MHNDDSHQRSQIMCIDLIQTVFNTESRFRVLISEKYEVLML